MKPRSPKGGAGTIEAPETKWGCPPVRVADIDDLLGAPARLAILSTVADGGLWTFTALREETGLSDGNLHVQTRKLAQAGYLADSRVRQGNRTVTCFELTVAGRRVIEDHVRRLQNALSGQRADTMVRARRGGELGSAADASRVW